MPDFNLMYCRRCVTAKRSLVTVCNVHLHKIVRQVTPKTASTRDGANVTSHRRQNNMQSSSFIAYRDMQAAETDTRPRGDCMCAERPCFIYNERGPSVLMTFHLLYTSRLPLMHRVAYVVWYISGNRMIQHHRFTFKNLGSVAGYHPGRRHVLLPHDDSCMSIFTTDLSTAARCTAIIT